MLHTSCILCPDYQSVIFLASWILIDPSLLSHTFLLLSPLRLLLRKEIGSLLWNINFKVGYLLTSFHFGLDFRDFGLMLRLQRL